MNSGRPSGEIQAVLDLFEPLGVSGEAMTASGILALDVPAGADVAAIKRLLAQGDADGPWAHEESCIDQAWRDA
jgi:hypothetical protein